MICPKCNTELPKDAIFCTECGFKLPKMKQCIYCKSYIDENAIFCTECGKRLIQEEFKIDTKKIPNFNNKKHEIKPVPNPDFVLKPAQPNNNSQNGLKKVKKSPTVTTKKNNTINNKGDKVAKLEKKFGISLRGKKWFQCTIEEVKYSTFNNMPNRNVDTAYVIVYEDSLEIYKESVFIKTNMGSRKLYFSNIASIDYDARGVFHASSSAIINTKSAEHVQLKFVSQENYNLMNNAFSKYINNLNRPKPTPVQTTTVNNPISNADELMKYAELFEKGFLTKEEFEAKKKELL